MSMLVAGSSLAVILGLPVGRIIGLQLGWRMSFFAMAAVAVVILLYMAVVFPKLPKTEPFSFRQLPELLHNKVLMGLYGVNILVPMSQYTAYSYIEPFMKQAGGLLRDNCQAVWNMLHVLDGPERPERQDRA